MCLNLKPLIILVLQFLQLLDHFFMWPCDLLKHHFLTNFLITALLLEQLILWLQLIKLLLMSFISLLQLQILDGHLIKVFELKLQCRNNPLQFLVFVIFLKGNDLLLSIFGSLFKSLFLKVFIRLVLLWIALEAIGIVLIQIEYTRIIQKLQYAHKALSDLLERSWVLADVWNLWKIDQLVLELLSGLLIICRIVFLGRVLELLSLFLNLEKLDLIVQ